MTHMGKKELSQNLQDWVEARRRHHLSHAHVQMARELGMNPRKLGKLDNHDQEPWKAPLPQFIEHLYRKRFGRPCPDKVLSIEERACVEEKREAERHAAKRLRREGAPGVGSAATASEATRLAAETAAAEPGLLDDDPDRRPL